MFVVGLSTYIGLRLLGVPYALPLAILAGLLEVIPIVGPIVAAIPAVIIGFGISAVIGVSTIALAFLIQQVENYVFVPAIMNKSVGLSSLVILLSLSVGFRLVGVVGAIVSIPAFLTLQVLARELPKVFKK
jgi:predicted PurR-regulated permease PerM